MAVTETIILNGDSSGAQTATKSLKKDISDLRTELDTLDRGSENYNATQQKLIDKMKEQTARNNELKKAVGSGGLKAEIRMLRNELGSLTEGTTEYNTVFSQLSAKMLAQKELSAKLKTSSKDFGDTVGNAATTMGGMVGAFSAVNAAMGLFGSESEDVQKAMLKVQQLMAVTQGLTQIDDAIKAWGRLKGNIQAYTQTAQTATNVNKGLVGSNIETASSEASIAAGVGAVSAAQIKKGQDGVKAGKQIESANIDAALSESKLASEIVATQTQIINLNSKLGKAKSNLTGADVKGARYSTSMQNIETTNKALQEQQKKLKDLKAAQTSVNNSQEAGAVASGKLASGLKAVGKAGAWMIAITAIIWLATKAWDALTSSSSKQEEETKKQIEAQKELSTTIGESASKNISSFNVMKKEWDSLGGNVVKQRKFIKEYKDELKVLFGDGKITLQQYSDYFGKFSDEVVNGYMLQAKAAAYMAAYQKAIAKEVSLELQDIVYENAGFWDTLVAMFNNPNMKEADVRKKVTEKNRKEAEKQREIDKQKAKDDAKRAFTEAGKNADAAEKQFKDLNIKHDKNSKDSNNATIKSYKELNEEFIKFKDQNSKIREDWFITAESENEQYYENLKRTQSDNYNEMYLGTEQYLDQKSYLNKLKAGEDLKNMNDDAKKLKDTQTAILDNNIKGITENLNKATGLSQVERDKQIALKTSYENERVQLTDNFNTTMLNNTAKYNTAISNAENKTYQERQANLANFYQSQITENDRSLAKINLGLQLKMEELKVTEANKKGNSFLKSLFGLDESGRDARIKEMELQIEGEKEALENSIKDADVLKAKIADPNTGIEERKKAEEELTKLMGEQSNQRIAIANDEAKQRSDAQKDIEDAMFGVMDAAGSVLSAMNEIYQAELDNTLGGLKDNVDKSKSDLQSRYDQGLISKEQYDKDMVSLEDDYNQEVYKEQVKAQEKQKKIQIFQAIIGGLSASIKAFSSVADIPFVGFGLGIAAVAATMAMTYAQVRAIEAQRIDAPTKSSASSSATSTISGGSLSYQSANLTSSNEQLLNAQNKNNQPIFVSVTDINNVQNRVKVVDTQSTF